MDKVKLDKHIAITSATDISQICRGLFKLSHINYFSYFREYKDGSRIWLCNNADWTYHLYQHAYHKVTSFSLPDYTVKKLDSQKLHGRYFWETLNSYIANRKENKLYEKRLNVAKEQFSIGNGMSIIECMSDFTDYYSFATSPNNIKIKDFYLNQSDLLYAFCKDFQEKATKIIQLSNRQKIIEANRKKLTKVVYGEFSKIIKKYEKKFNRVYINNTTYLTQREYDCLKLASVGKTAKEIGKTLGLSFRTVEAYCQSLLSKLELQKKSQLIEYYRDTFDGKFGQVLELAASSDRSDKVTAIKEQSNHEMADTGCACDSLMIKRKR